MEKVLVSFEALQKKVSKRQAKSRVLYAKRDFISGMFYKFRTLFKLG
jgi:hypothetical protein